MENRFRITFAFKKITNGLLNNRMQRIFELNGTNDTTGDRVGQTEWGSSQSQTRVK